MEKLDINIVEKTILLLLDKGCSQAAISEMLGFDAGYVITELAYKGILYPDGKFRDAAYQYLSKNND